MAALATTWPQQCLCAGPQSFGQNLRAATSAVIDRPRAQSGPDGHGATDLSYFERLGPPGTVTTLSAEVVHHGRSLGRDLVCHGHGLSRDLVRRGCRLGHDLGPAVDVTSAQVLRLIRSTYCVLTMSLDNL